MILGEGTFCQVNMDDGPMFIALHGRASALGDFVSARVAPVTILSKYEIEILEKAGVSHSKIVDTEFSMIHLLFTLPTTWHDYAEADKALKKIELSDVLRGLKNENLGSVSAMFWGVEYDPDKHSNLCTAVGGLQWLDELMFITKGIEIFWELYENSTLPSAGIRAKKRAEKFLEGYMGKVGFDLNWVLRQSDKNPKKVSMMLGEYLWTVYLLSEWPFVYMPGDIKQQKFLKAITKLNSIDFSSIEPKAIPIKS